MILVYDEILDRIENCQKYVDVYAENSCKPLIEYYDPDNIQGASYDVTMNNKLMVQKSNVNTISLDNKSDVENVFELKDNFESYILKPAEYIIVQLKERINMPDDLCAHIRPRTTFNKLGLIITSQHINPSYSGTLYVGIKNMTAQAFNIKPRLIIGQIVFEKLSGKVKSEILYRNNANSKYQGENGDFIHSKVSEETQRIANDLYNEFLRQMKE